MECEQKFKAAVEWVRDDSNVMPTTTQEKLDLYGLYKQATVGDNTDSQPWAMQIEAKAKWTAWTSHKGTGTTDAMTKYVKTLEKQATKYGKLCDLIQPTPLC